MKTLCWLVEDDSMPNSAVVFGQQRGALPHFREKNQQTSL